MKTIHFKSYAMQTLVILFAVIMFTPGCKNDDDDPPEDRYFTLGVILPMDNDNGPLRENALKTAIADINANGGIGNGYLIELKVGSSEGDDRAVAAAATANQIINSTNNLVGFITSYSSSSYGVVTQVAAPGHYPVISGSSTSDKNSGISEYFQRLCPPDSLQAMVISNKAGEYNINSVAIAVQDSDDYSSGLANNFKNNYPGQISAEISFIKNDPDIENKVDQLVANNPEAIFISMIDADIYTELLTKLDQLNSRYDFSNTYFMFCDALHSANIFNAPLSILTGEITGNPKNFGVISAPDTSRVTYQYFENALYQEFQQEVASFNAQFYDAGYIFALAIEQAIYMANLDNMANFREVVNDLIRPISRGETIGDPTADPVEGWPYMKALAASGGINYLGASGNCDIDDSGNAFTPYQIFTIVESGGNYSFEVLGYYNP